MTRVERREFESLARLGPVDLANREDPVAVALRSAGITEQDLRSIGNGDLILWGDEELSALYDKLNALDQKDGSRRSDRPDAIARLMRARRSGLSEPPPGLPRYEELNTKEALWRGDAEQQAGPALRALARAERATIVPVEILDAARKAADPKTDPKVKGQARSQVTAWFATQAAHAHRLQADLVGQRMHLEQLIGGQENGRPRPGYYERLLGQAALTRQNNLVRAGQGHPKAQDAVAHAERVRLWAQRELTEARTAYRQLIAGETRLRGITADSARVLAELTANSQRTDQAVASVDRRINEYAAMLESAQKEARELDVGAAKRLLVESHRELSERVAAVSSAIQGLEAEDLDPPMRQWVETSGVLAVLEAERAGLLAQLAEIDTAHQLLMAPRIAQRSETAFLLLQATLVTTNAAVGALLSESDGKLELREQGLREMRGRLDTEIRSRRVELERAEQRIKTLERQAALTTEEVFELRELRLAVDGVAPSQDGTKISLREEIKALNASLSSVDAAFGALNNRRNELSQKLQALGGAFGVNLAVKTDNAGLLEGIRQLESYANLSGFTAKPDGTFQLEYKVRSKATDKERDLKTETLVVGPKSSYGELRSFVLAYERRKQQQVAVAYENLRAITGSMGNLDDTELAKLGLGKLTAKDAAKPNYLETRLPKVLSVYGHLMGVGKYGAVNERALIEWSQKPDPKTFPKLEIKDATSSVQGMYGAFRFLEEHGARYGSPRLAFLAAIADPARLDALMDQEYPDPLALNAPQPDLDNPIRNRTTIMTLAFMRLALLDKTAAHRLGLDLHLDPTQLRARFEQWHREYTAIEAHHQRPVPKVQGDDVEQRQVTPVEPSFFPEAEGRVKRLDPMEYRSWGLRLFEQTRSLDRGQRAYLVLLFDATYTKKNDETFKRNLSQKADTPTALGTQLSGGRAGDAAFALHLIEGKPAIERREEMRTTFLDKPGGIDTFLIQQRLQAARFRTMAGKIPQAELPFFERRIGEVAKLAEELASAEAHLIDLRAKRLELAKSGSDIDQQIQRTEASITASRNAVINLGAETLVLNEGLSKAMDAEITYKDQVDKNFKKFWKSMGVAAAAMAAAYLTAGALAPKAGVAVSAIAATAAGTASGMAVSFAWDVADQAAQKGLGGVSGYQALDAALDDLPAALMAAAPTGVVTASLARYGQVAQLAINEGRTIRLAGMTINRAQFIDGAKQAAILATSSGLSTGGAQWLAGHIAKARAKNAQELQAAQKLIDGAITEGVFAAVSAPAMMPFSRFGPLADAALNGYQKLIYNGLLGKDLSDGMLDAVVMGGLSAQMFKTIRNVQAARSIHASNGVGTKVRIPGELGGAQWTLKSVSTKHGSVVLEGGFPPRALKMSAEAILSVNPQLRPPTPTGVDAKTWIGAEPRGKVDRPGPAQRVELPAPAHPDAPRPTDPTLNGQGTEARAIATQLDQQLRRSAIPAVEDQTHGATDVTVRSQQNADGSAEIRAHVHEARGGVGIAELSLRIDPKTKTVHIQSLAVAKQLKGDSVARSLFGAQAQVLRTHFPGWKVAVEAPTGSGRGHHGDLRGLLELHFGGVTTPKRGEKTYRADIGENRGVIDRLVSKSGWDRGHALAVDRGSQSVRVERDGQAVQVPVSEVLNRHPELVRGMAVDHDGARFTVGEKNKRGEFELIPMDGKFLGRRPRVTGEQLYRKDPGAVEEVLLPPKARIRVIEQGIGGPISKDQHGYRVIGHDRTSDTVYLRNPNGEIEGWAGDRVAYEASGVALGSLGVAQHARYQARLLALDDTQLVAWAKIAADAADLSSSHLTMVQRSFAAGHDLTELRGLLTATAKVPRAELAEFFSPKGMAQDFKMSCVPAACLAGVATIDPLFAKYLKDNPKFMAALQRAALEGAGGSAVTRVRDPEYPQHGTIAEEPGTRVPADQVSGQTHWYTNTSRLDAELTAHTLNSPGSLNNRTVVIGHGFPMEHLRLRGDAQGKISVEFPVGSNQWTRVKGELFRANGAGLEYIGGKTPISVRELGVPGDVTFVAPGGGQGMVAGNSPLLKSIYELRTGQRYEEHRAAHLTQDQFKEVVDQTLDADLPFAYSVTWHDPRTNAALHGGHQLAVLQRSSEVPPKYLVQEVHEGRPAVGENQSWLTIDQLYEYRYLSGALGRPNAVFVPDLVPVPPPAPAVSSPPPTTTPHPAPTTPPPLTAGGPPARPSRTPLPAQVEVRADAFATEVMRGRSAITRAQADDLYRLGNGRALDPVTEVLFQHDDLAPTLDRVIKAAKEDAGAQAWTARASFRNLAGVNADRGHTGADAIFKKYAELTQKALTEMNARGLVVHGFRDGPDMTFVIQGEVSRAHLDMALAKARIQVSEFVNRERLGWIDHPKHKGKIAFTGTDLTYSMKRVAADDTLDSIEQALRAGGDARDTTAGRTRTPPSSSVRRTPRDVPPPAGGSPAVRPTRLAGQPHFMTQRELAFEQFRAYAESLPVRLDPAEIRRLFELTPAARIDRVTGYGRAEERVPTMARAITHRNRAGEDALYVEIDIKNLGGLTQAVGRENADTDFRVAADLIRQELSGIGADVAFVRHGADEVSAIVVGPGITERQIADALERGQARYANYIEARGLADLPHPKAPNDPNKRGVGFVFGIARAGPHDAPQAVFARADAQVELKKQGGRIEY